MGVEKSVDRHRTKIGYAKAPTSYAPVLVTVCETHGRVVEISWIPIENVTL